MDDQSGSNAAGEAPSATIRDGLSGRIWLALAGYLFVRWVLLVRPGYPWDIGAYKHWALYSAAHGISRVYESAIDYPPLYVWILHPLGKIYSWLAPEAFAARRDSVFLTALMKLPPLMFDLAIAFLIYRVVRSLAVDRPGAYGSRSPSFWRWLLPAAYLLNPVVLFSHGHWGQVDSIHTFFVLAAFLSLGSRAAWPAWALLSLATLMKPLGAPFFPLLLALSWLRFGWKRTAVGGAAALATAAVVFSPYIATGRVLQVFHRVLGDVQVMPYTSTNGHNLWWAIGPWRDAREPLLGPLSANHVAMALFGLAYAAILLRVWRLHRSQPGGIDRLQGLALAAAVCFSFFTLSTQMHENHLFAVMPLILLMLPVARVWRWLFAGVTLAVFANLVLHDLRIPERWPFTLGGPSSTWNVHLDRPFAVFENAAIQISTYFNLALFGIFLYLVLRPGRLLEPLARQPRREAARTPASTSASTPASTSASTSASTPASTSASTPEGTARGRPSAPATPDPGARASDRH